MAYYNIILYSGHAREHRRSAEWMPLKEIDKLRKTVGESALSYRMVAKICSLQDRRIEIDPGRKVGRSYR